MRPLSRMLFAFLFVPVAALAQFQEKVTISYVEVPVTVVGRDGKAVRGLTKANFEIFDDEAKRAIDSFEAIDFAAEATHKVISPLNPASRRNFLLLFDLSYSNPGSLVRAQDAARNFVERSMGRRDLVGIGAVDVDRGFRLLTAFTSDRNLLAAAIGDPRNFKSFDPLQIASSNLYITSNGPEGSGGIEDTGGEVALENAADFMRNMAKMDDAHRRMRVKKQFEILGDVASALQRLHGRKHLVLLSEGFDARLVQGRHAASVQEQRDENAAISDGEIWKVDSDIRFGSTSMQTVLAEMAETFRRSDVVLHAVDIQGVRVQNDIREGARVNSNDSLFLMANSTGGTVFRNSNDITDDFQRLADLHQVVYVLGFRAPVGKPGEFHQLKVKLVNVPGARAQYRGGYYEVGGESLIERSLSTAEVIVNDIPQEDIDVDALASAFPSTTETSQVPVILEISGDDLLAHAKNNLATVDIYSYAFDEDGVSRASLTQRIRLDVTKVGDKLRGSGIKFYGTMNLPPGKYAIKNLVRVAESDKKGYQRIDVVVPGEYDVAVLQPFFFEQEGEWIMVKANDEGENPPPYPFVLDGESFIPSAKAKLRRGEPRLFTVFVYNAEAAELTMQVAPAAKLVSTSQADFVTKYVFALEQFQPDLTAVDVTVRKSGSGDERRVSVPVSVQ